MKLWWTMEEKNTKNDLLLIGGGLVLALVAYLVMSFWQGQATHNAKAIVTIDGAFYGSFSLDTDAVEKIELPDGNYNILEIKEGKADITKASCPDGICVQHRAISKQSQSIVCLPNKVVVEIESGEEAEVDAITN